MDEDWIRPARVLVCLLVFLLLAAFNLGIVCRQMPPTGDEPHYLITAHSLALDQDLSLQNNYLQKQYRAFYPGELAKRTTPSADGKRELPAEGLGLSFLLTPAYRFAVAVLPPAWLVAFLRLFLCSITVIVLYELIRMPLESGIMLCCAAFFCSPLLFYSGQFYPEIPAALLVAASLRQALEMEEHPWNALVVLALVPGALVWLHPKYLALAMTLLIGSAFLFQRTFRVYHEAKNPLRILLLLTIGLAGIFTFFLFLRQEYGGWSPNRIYAGWEPQQQKTLIELVQQEGFARIGTMLRMLPGYWMDQRFGLLVYAPFYIAFFPALWCMIRRRLPLAGFVTALIAVHFLGLCWGAPLGGFAPPSRHLVVLLPLLLFPILSVHSFWSRAQRAVFYGLVSVSVAIALIMAAHYRALFSDLTWRNPDGVSPFWQMWHLESILPSVTATDLLILLILCWTVFFAAIAVYLYPREKS